MGVGRTCGLVKPRPKPLHHLSENWHGLVCPYCYGARYRHGDAKENSLKRRASFETWEAANLVHKRFPKPKGKILGARFQQLRQSPFAMAAFAGQLSRTHTALREAGLHDMMEPLGSYMKELGV